MERLDVYLAKQGFFETREKAKEAITSGIISLDGKICTKPSQMASNLNKIEIVGKKLKYVSRAGLKLEEAANVWKIDFKNKIVLDVGASTGGFTDFALQNCARKVYSVDVGTNQLSPKLKENKKVVCMEQTDFRNMPKLKDQIDILVCDCSFISITLLAAKFAEVLSSGKSLVTLIKPQFECGKDIAKKCKGIIKDQTLQEQLKNKVIQGITEHGFDLVGSCPSPILGTAGNKEYLAYFIKK